MEEMGWIGKRGWGGEGFPLCGNIFSIAWKNGKKCFHTVEKWGAGNEARVPAWRAGADAARRPYLLGHTGGWRRMHGGKAAGGEGESHAHMWNSQ